MSAGFDSSSPIVRRPSARIITRARLPDSAGAQQFAPAGADRMSTVALLLFVLPLFGQTFYYFNQWPLPYFLSKGWPILMLPFFVRGMTADHLPARWLFVLMLSYMVGLTPIVSMIHFGNPFSDAVLTTIEIWPFVYYPAFLGLLLWLRPSDDTLRNCVVALGLATYVLMLVLWIVLPQAWYTSDTINEKFLIYEIERGYRIYMPMFFGMLLVFYLARRFSARMEWWTAAGIVACFVLMLMIYKQRTSVGSAAVVVALVGCPPHWRRVAAAAAGIAAAIGLFALLTTPVGERVAEQLGGSLLVRINSLRSVSDYINDNALDWIFGLGTVTRFSNVTLGEVLGNKFFFLADLGWIGVIFKYGVVGALFVAAAYVAGWLISFRNGRALASPFALALSDYILFVIVTTLVYSPTFLSGEMATVLAISVYLAHRSDIFGLATGQTGQVVRDSIVRRHSNL